MKRMKRRAMLKGTIFGGTVAIGLPMLDAMLPRTAAQTGSAPKRVVFWFTPNGTRQDIWTPSANMDLSGHPLHAPLTPFSEKLIFLGGVWVGRQGVAAPMQDEAGAVPTAAVGPRRTAEAPPRVTFVVADVDRLGGLASRDTTWN